MAGAFDVEGCAQRAAESGLVDSLAWLRRQAEQPVGVFAPRLDLDNTVHANDIDFYSEVHRVIDEEPAEAFSPGILGLMSAIGIEKGQRFDPGSRLLDTSGHLEVLLLHAQDGQGDCLFATGRDAHPTNAPGHRVSFAQHVAQDDKSRRPDLVGC